VKHTRPTKCGVGYSPTANPGLSWNRRAPSRSCNYGEIAIRERSAPMDPHLHLVTQEAGGSSGRPILLNLEICDESY